MKFLLDTNICIYLIRQKPPEVLARFAAHPVGEIAVSSITVSEMAYGAAKSSRPEGNRDALFRFLTPLVIADYDAKAADHYGRVRAFLEAAGKPIGALDLFIAAHALSLDLTLVTNNVGECKRVPGLHVENWVNAK